MIVTLALMILGIFLGILLRGKPMVLKSVELSISVAIYLLLFLLGNSVGMNKVIISNLGTIGLQALLLATGSVAGSVAVTYLVYKSFFRVKA